MEKEKVVWLKHVREDFYEVYNDDAFIISELMDYKLVLEYKNLIKTGFPEMALDKVISTLRKNKVPYQVSDDDSLVAFFGKDNHYDRFVKKDRPVERVYSPYIPKYSGNFEVTFLDDNETEKFVIGDNIEGNTELVAKVYEKEIGSIITLNSGIKVKIINKSMTYK